MSLRVAAEAVVTRAAALGMRGRTLTSDERQRLASALPIYPFWLLDLLCAVPLCGLELGWRASEPEPDFDGVEWIRVSDADGILWESMQGYPGLGILPAGYMNFGGDAGVGDSYFLPVHEGDDPPLYQVFHDVGEDAATILADRRCLVASRLSEVFRQALLAGEAPR
jgi:hypothetical protein